MNKSDELRNIIQDLNWFLDLGGDAVSEIRSRGLLPTGDPDVPLTGKVRVLIAVEATVPIDNNAEYAFANALDHAVRDALHETWHFDSTVAWLQYLDGPAAGIIS